MKPSLYQKLRAEATKEYENKISSIPLKIKRRDALRHAFPCRRAGDIPVKISFESNSAIYMTATVEKYDPKTFWLLAERFFDALELSMAEATEDRNRQIHEIWKVNSGVVYSFQLRTTKACRPIYRKIVKNESTEIIGYSCN